ncbi:UDP-N-acetylmuramoyl-tripeptide--D-alanyl-D-alanine ligase [Paenibacillus sp. Dod16]|uniref:UDP-N-acetylmuramoyl-tripeptide--D-alanyl-D- alanine ligase n=1 Tax=Paenibacillus sp. Dod16 TaxID=3416392 RepID=UPI003CF243D3
MRSNKCVVIGITGSSGKTTTKEMIASILQQRHRVFKSYKNGNDCWFTSQYAKQIKPSHEYAVLEFGMKHAGEITKHCQLIQPDIGLITNIGKAHIGNFKHGINGIAASKSEIISGMKPNGLLVTNADDPNSKKLTFHDSFKGRIVTIGIKQTADYRAGNIRYSTQGMSFSVMLRGANEHFDIPSIGIYNVQNSLFAIAVCDQLGIPVSDIKHGLLHYERPYARMELNHLNNGAILINDAYNTKPELNAALDVLRYLSKGKRRVAVIGGITDTGKWTKNIHYQAGKDLARSDLHALYTFGTKGKHIAIGAKKNGMKKHVVHVASMAELKRKVQREIGLGSVILFKGAARNNNTILMRFIDRLLGSKTRENV